MYRAPGLGRSITHKMTNQRTTSIKNNIVENLLRAKSLFSYSKPSSGWLQEREQRTTHQNRFASFVSLETQNRRGCRYSDRPTSLTPHLLLDDDDVSLQGRTTVEEPLRRSTVGPLDEGGVDTLRPSPSIVPRRPLGRGPWGTVIDSLVKNVRSFRPGSYRQHRP